MPSKRWVPERSRAPAFLRGCRIKPSPQWWPALAEVAARARETRDPATRRTHPPDDMADSPPCLRSDPASWPGVFPTATYGRGSPPPPGGPRLIGHEWQAIVLGGALARETRSIGTAGVEAEGGATEPRRVARLTGPGVSPPARRLSLPGSPLMRRASSSSLAARLGHLQSFTTSGGFPSTSALATRSELSRARPMWTQSSRRPPDTRHRSSWSEIVGRWLSALAIRPTPYCSTTRRRDRRCMPSAMQQLTPASCSHP